MRRCGVRTSSPSWNHPIVIFVTAFSYVWRGKAQWVRGYLRPKVVPSIILTVRAEFWPKSRLLTFRYVFNRAYQFWRANASTFKAGFHTCGYSGHALRLARWAFKLGGVSAWVERMAEAPTVEEQGRIWDKHVKPVLLAPWITRLFLANPYVPFCVSPLKS